MRPALVAAFLALLSCATPPKSVEAGPVAWPAPREAPAARALVWEVTHDAQPGRRMFLGGSVHVGNAARMKLPPAMQSALRRSDVLAVEVDTESIAPAEMQRLVVQLGTYPKGRTLSGEITKETARALDAFLGARGLPRAAFEPMRPWLVSVTLATMELQKAGYDQKSGIEHALLALARGKKKILELETAESQLRALAGIDPKVADGLLREQLVGGELTTDAIEQLFAAWQSGDADALAALVFEDAGRPDLAPAYEAIYFGRNRAMAAKLEGLFGSAPTHFAVVGAGHMCGKEGIPALFERRGFKVRQLPRDEE